MKTKQIDAVTMRTFKAAPFLWAERKNFSLSPTNKIGLHFGEACFSGVIIQMKEKSMQE
jgi:hypothetical protein